MEPLVSHLTIVGVEWSDGEPTVRAFEGNATESTHVELVGLRLNYRAGPDSPRQCLGRPEVTEQGSRHLDCSHAPESGQRQCTRCAIAEATFASNLHHAHTKERASIDAAFRVHLAKPNVLYLAGFRDGSIKVGTSAVGRRYGRLAEQGAWSARISVEASDGYAVRDLEDQVTAELGLPQSVSARRKLDGMATPVPDVRLEVELSRWRSMVGELVEASNDERFVALDESWRHPRARADAWDHIHLYPLDPATGQHDLEVVEACGRLVAVRRPGSSDTFVFDLQRVYGVQLELGQFTSDELAVQDSLF